MFCVACDHSPAGFIALYYQHTSGVQNSGYITTEKKLQALVTASC